jgi:hypothetical protein
MLAVAAASAKRGTQASAASSAAETCVITNQHRLRHQHCNIGCASYLATCTEFAIVWPCVQVSSCSCSLAAWVHVTQLQGLLQQEQCSTASLQKQHCAMHLTRHGSLHHMMAPSFVPCTLVILGTQEAACIVDVRVL